MARLFISFLIVFSVTAFAYNKVSVTEGNSGETVFISNGQLLHVRLYSPYAGSGCCWSVKEMRTDILREFGDWDFEQTGEVDASGAPAMGVPDGYQTIRFAGVKAGESRLILEYKRPWEKDSPALQTFSVYVQTRGAYCGSGRERFLAKMEPDAASGDPTTTSFSKAYHERYNLMDYNVLTPVKDQKISECGSCWAHGTCAVFETLIKATDGVERDISEQWFVNCDNTSYGCQGGWCAFKYFVSKGCVYEADEPYIAQDEDCLPSYPYKEKAASFKKIYASSFVPAVDSLKKYILAYGSLVVCIRYNNTQFMNYKNGIFTYNDTRQTDHILEMVGWNDSAGGFWYLKNSFGTAWGENGYMRIKWGVSGVGTDPYYLVYKKPLGQLGVSNPLAPYSNNQQKFFLFQNPGRNSFTIQYDSPKNAKLALSVLDMRGRIVSRHDVLSGKREELSVRGLAKGLYLVHVTGPGIGFQQRVVLK